MRGKFAIVYTTANGSDRVEWLKSEDEAKQRAEYVLASVETKQVAVVKVISMAHHEVAWVRS